MTLITNNYLRNTFIGKVNTTKDVQISKKMILIREIRNDSYIIRYYLHNKEIYVYLNGLYMHSLWD